VIALNQASIVSQNLSTPEELYLDLLKGCLTRSLFSETSFTDIWRPVRPPGGPIRGHVFSKVLKLLASQDLMLAKRVSDEPWQPPRTAETMIGLRRLGNIQDCVTDVLRRNVPGDLIETGVWRGGATIFMRGILKAYRDTTRTVWVADSFRGLPEPDAERYPVDEGSTWHKVDSLKIGLEEVKRNFARYRLLDDQVRFLVGWFRDTLPSAPIQQLAVMRLDGDMYESTMDALRHLYPKLSVGGYVIIDDYNLPECRAAVTDYRAEQGISEPIEDLKEGIEHQNDAIWQRLH
jgi:O-methyltransferase